MRERAVTLLIVNRRNKTILRNTIEYLIIVFILFGGKIFICESNAAGQQITTDERAKVFLDCWMCDFNYIRQEIPYVDYVTDRIMSDIHIMVTYEQTGGYGRKFTMTFYGQQRYFFQNDTLIFTTSNDDTEDEVREKMVQYLKMGLMQYITKTAIADNISIEYRGDEDIELTEDDWDWWTFRTNLNANFDGESRSESYSINIRVNIQRITEDWKIRVSSQLRYDRDEYDVDDERVVSTSSRKNVRGLVVKSLSDHWSVGVSSGVYSNTYSNTKLSVGGSPAIEFNVFPYSESTRRELRFLYSAGYDYTRYNEETIYSKMREHLLEESLEIAFELKQPWGSVRTTVRGSHYFHDLEKNNINIRSDISLRLIRGFSFSLHGGFSMIHDQLSLPKREETTEEVLLRRRELETQYSYWGGIGFEYAFGSIYNNVVNPRFGN